MTPIGAVNLSIQQPDAADLFSGTAIVSEASDGALRLVPGVEWAQSATTMVQQAFLDRLTYEGAPGGGSVFAAGVAGAADFEIVSRPQTFLLRDTQGVCAIQVSILNGRTRAPLVQETFTATANAADDKNTSRAKALSEAGNACVASASEWIAQNTAALKAKTSAR